MKIHILLFLSLLMLNHAEARDRTFNFNGKTYTYDEAMLMESPPDGVKVVKGVEGCTDRVEQYLGLPYRVFDLLNQVEGGENGLAVLSVSTDGRHKSWDVGRYQINEINWSQYDGDMTPFDLRWNDCANLIAAAYRVLPFYKDAKSYYKANLKKTGGDELLDEVLYRLAGYNSETPEIRGIYRDRLKVHFVRYLLEGKNVALW